MFFSALLLSSTIGGCSPSRQSRAGTVPQGFLDVSSGDIEAKLRCPHPAPTGLRLKAQGCPPGGLPWVDGAKTQLPQRGCGSAGGTCHNPVGVVSAACVFPG